MRGKTDTAAIAAIDRGAARPLSTICTTQVRVAGADLLRLASLLSIVLFHVVLRDAQFAAATSSPRAGTFDALICVSTVFDNRSMAVLSLFLLLLRHGDAPYPAVIAGRTRRLLLPYLAWTLLYPFLDLAIASLTGQLQPALDRMLDVRFWLSGVFLATMKEHLHFLPTLLVLTLLFPVYKRRLSTPLVLVLLMATSALRAGAEFVIVGRVYNPSISELAVLSVLRTVEYFPLGFLAFISAQEVRQARTLARFKMFAIAIIALVPFSAWLEPDQFAALGAVTARFTWSLAQAMLGTVAMALAAQGVLLGGGFEARADERLGVLGRIFSERALALFLVHPFFCDVFDAIVTAPIAYDVRMVIPKFAFVLVSSLFASSVLVGTRGLRAIV
jgi:hypothetical protein